MAKVTTASKATCSCSQPIRTSAFDWSLRNGRVCIRFFEFLVQCWVKKTSVSKSIKNCLNVITLCICVFIGVCIPCVHFDFAGTLVRFLFKISSAGHLLPGLCNLGI